MSSNSLIHTDVTVVKRINKFTLAAIGGALYVYYELLLVLEQYIFDGQKIHGLKLNEENTIIILFGGKKISVLKITFANNTVNCKTLKNFDVSDWIQDLILYPKNNSSTEELELVLSTSHNTVEKWFVRSNFVERRTTARCTEKCILYSSLLIENAENEIIHLAGTVFSEVVIWMPKDVVEDNVVLHRLKGHTGVIFSITIDKTYRHICTTSDDRSIRIWSISFPTNHSSTTSKWKNATITLTHTLFGHTGRVWKSLLTDDYIVSVSEDSKVCLWSNSGKLLNSWNTHQNGGVWSCDICEQQEIIITGGSDGGISVWPYSIWSQTIHPTRINLSTIDSLGDCKKLIPRRVVFLKDKVLTITLEGQLHCTKGGYSSIIFQDEKFRSYCLLNISNCNTYVSLCSIYGDLVILEFVNEKWVSFVDKKITEGKIFSFHWLSENLFLVCGLDGVLNLHDLKNQLCSYLLPKSRERWTTCAFKHNASLVVGDRMGNIYLYLGTSQYPSKSFPKIHGFLGVADLKLYEQRLLTTGRDGSIRTFKIENDTLEYYVQCKLPFEWGSKILMYSNKVFIFGFSEVNFVLWDLETQTIILKIACGGGHRFWDCQIINDLFRFVCIKENVVWCYEYNINDLTRPSIRNGFHSKEINNLKIYKDIFISASEDTSVKLSTINKDVVTLCNLQSHICSVRGLDMCQVKDRSFLLTAGGRAQLYIWELRGNECRELCFHMLNKDLKQSWKEVTVKEYPDTRYMDVSSIAEGLNILIAVASSDCMIRLFLFDTIDFSLKLEKTLHSSMYCVLKVIFLRHINSIFMLSMATDGFLVFWEVSKMFSNKNEVPNEPVSKFQIHQSGINSIDILEIAVGTFLIATGGDDNMVSLTCVQLMESDGNYVVIKKRQWKNSLLHACQVTGVRLLKNLLITASIDQRITALLIDMNHDDLDVTAHFVSQCCSTVSDIQGLEVVTFDKTLKKLSVCVYGKGIEIMDVKID